MTREEAERMHAQVPGWTLNAEGTVLSCSFPFKDFQKALEFVNKVGEAAQAEWHHPMLTLPVHSDEDVFALNLSRRLTGPTCLPCDTS